MLHDQLQDIFRKIFNDNSINIHDQMMSNHIAGWDSLTHVSLILEVERFFSIRLSTTEISRLKNVGDLKNLIEEKLTEKIL